MTYSVRTIRDDETLLFRQAHLWPDKPIDHVKVEGDETALHLGAFDGETLIGVASFFRQGTRVQLRKLAVAPDYRGQGLGKALITAGATQMRQEGFDELWCDARQTASSFYENLGFTVDETTFEKSGLAYQIARLSLKDQRL